MTTLALRLVLTAFVSLLAACASPQIGIRAITDSDPAAEALLAESQRAHGASAFAKIRDISVRYDGRWASIGPRFQPVVADRTFRRSSEERLLIAPRVMAQEHTGPAGNKSVVRTPGEVVVDYNGSLSTDRDTQRAAAIVADAYTMFLLGPFYFDRPGVVLAANGEAVVDQSICDTVLAVLRPGFGFAEEDRVVLFIDRTTKELRRVQMTLNGFDSTRGAEVDVTFRNFRRIDGVLWPTEFDERIRVPFDLPAHRWQMLGLDTNRGFSASDLTASGFKNRAADPAAPLLAQ